MKWFRRHIKTGSRLALCALAVQFVLSFGHFHFDAAQAAAAVAAQGQTDLTLVQGVAPDAASQAQQQPSSHHDGQPAHEPCAICAVMSMANQMLFAAVALLPLPDAVEQSFLVADAEFGLPGTPQSAFQSRAPPLS